MKLGRAQLGPAAISAIVLAALLSPHMVPGASAQEYETSPGGQPGQPGAYPQSGYGYNGPPPGEPPIEGVPMPNPNANQPWQPAPEEYSSQPQYSPPPFVNPQPVTRRYGTEPAYPHTGLAHTMGYTTPWQPGGASQSESESGYQPPPEYPQQGQPQYSQQFGQQPPMQYGQASYANVYQPQRMATAPVGLDFPCTLNTAIATAVAKPGDYVQAVLQKNVSLSGAAYIPAGTMINGQVSQATGGRYFSRSGSLSLDFTQMKLPDGMTIPISAHTVGKIGKYADHAIGQNDQYRGEGWGTKLGQFALRTAVGAGGGLALGTAFGGMMGGNWQTGMLAGTAVGGGLGALDDLTLRKGKDVTMPAGTPMTIELDQPIQVPMGTFEQ